MLENEDAFAARYRLHAAGMDDELEKSSFLSKGVDAGLVHD